MQRKMERFGPYAGLAVLAGVGCLVALAAPSRTPVTQAAPPPVTQAHRALAGASPVATSAPTATVAAKPTAGPKPKVVGAATVAPLATDTPAPQPTATDTPAPQATATPVPPTPTPAPTWHAYVTKSGPASANVIDDGPVSMPSTWRMQVSCDSGTDLSIAYAITGGNSYTSHVYCQGVTFILYPPSQVGAAVTFDLITMAGGPWTITFEVYG